jgi:hypothetical protein
MSKPKRFSSKRMRSMTPEQRIQARLANEMQSALTKWRNSIERLAAIEVEARMNEVIQNGPNHPAPQVRIVAGRVEDYWPTPICANCETPLDESRWPHPKLPDGYVVDPDPDLAIG